MLDMSIDVKDSDISQYKLLIHVYDDDNMNFDDLIGTV